ncbi:DNA-binding transcriptional regulator, LysR family [Glycomyces sambucus]|uniref:DNA-binding transcriptional regulator, LysR family n=1 Tax=Glycomyces sambucus TaxID=380244 RepID=A0A1G9MXA4_9ACTN|nr:LysR family transcriptional regulator [Glycomyces sambucus]SDL78848.1 DNA-binding transcriptional regulator, LysR family [Glycomyces sambucus]
MDLRQMEYLVALADERHFTRAAELTGISQSGLSAAIRSLEDELGTALFTRTTRRVEPTEAGFALLPYARMMLEQAAGARDAVVKASRAVSGSLSIGAEQCLGLVDVNSLLDRFHRRHPRVETMFTQCGSHDLLGMLRAGELDVAFVATDRHLSTLPHRELGREPLVVVTPPDHPLAARATVPWEALDDQDFVDFGAAWGVRTLNESVFAARGARRRVRCTVNDVHTLLDLVGRGLGIAVVPRHVAAKPQAAALRVLPLADEDAPQWTVSVVSTAWDQADSPAAHLLDLLNPLPDNPLSDRPPAEPVRLPT